MYMKKDKRNIAPTLDEWKALYAAAEEFKKAACWEWMYDCDVFAVQDPITNQYAFISILGNAGNHFAIAGYLGSEGLYSLDMMFSAEPDTDSNDLLFIQKCLMCSFVSRDYMSKEDLKVIKNLGLKFRGKTAWPEFRSYEPGLYPWYLNSEQCVFLTHILQQSLEVSLRCKNNKNLIIKKNPYSFAARIPTINSKGEINWKDKTIEMEPAIPKCTSFCLADEIKARRLSSAKSDHRIVFEADAFYIPAPIKEEGRPYYPKASLIVDHNSGMLIYSELLKDINTEGHKIIDALINFIEENDRKPYKILVKRREIYYLLIGICEQLDINLEVAEQLEFVEEIKEELFDRMV